ncbi:hypothetical protein BRC81_09265 [Halobacteriales archaeon QS_1_68_20]|nr:MAG: hypothetical protein BRC81_09265 [Halobacteriales archaeon QS_1_68_20]
MEIRGRRECQDCGTRWSYYETGSVACPECGSVHSTGLDDERTLHTASPGELDLTPGGTAVDDLTPRELAREAKDEARPFVRRHGFVRGGALQPLDDTYLTAVELTYVADAADRALELDDREHAYLLELLGGADEGERPPPAEVPPPFHAARGLAVADAVEAYRREVRKWLEANPHPEVRDVLARVHDHERRVQALDGDIDPDSAERLLSAVREVGTYLIDGDDGALESARARLDRLDDAPA